MILPRIVELEMPSQLTTKSENLGKTFLYDFKSGEFVLKDGKPVEVTGKKAIEIWIEKILRTQKFRWGIYENVDYGTTIEDLIVGNSYPKNFLESELKREISQEVIKHPRIESLSDWSFTVEKEKLKVAFTVNLINGESMQQEVNF